MEDMDTIGMFKTILTELYNAYQSTQTVGPNKVARRISGVQESRYFGILSRLVLADPGAFVDKLATFHSETEFLSLGRGCWPSGSRPSNTWRTLSRGSCRVRAHPAVPCGRTHAGPGPEQAPGLPVHVDQRGAGSAGYHIR